ncbi:MAG: DNA/RNA nuclease SfsA [Bdellovibrionota bacterium]
MIILPYPHTLRKCSFIKRYKRFFVDVLLENGSTDTVHCANSGSMKNCLVEDVDTYTLDSFNEERKLRHSLELFNLNDGLACLNTSRANNLTEKILLDTIGKDKQNYYTKAHFPYEQFSQYNEVHREVKFSDKTRFDFCLTSSNSVKKCWIEVKSVSLCLNEHTYAFPDAVTERGQKHLIDLMAAKKLGHDAWLFFVMMRGSNINEDVLAKSFRACHEIDPKYASLLAEAKKEGVKIGIIVPEITIQGFGLRGVYVD